MLPLAYREYEPSRHLSEFVRAYFTFGPSEEVANGFAMKRSISFESVAQVCPIMMADMAGSLVIKSSDEWRIDVLDESGPQCAATLFGPMARAYATRIGPRINAAGVYFRVGALGSFFALPVDELLGRGLPISELFGGADHEAIAATFEVPNPTARLHVLESVLTRRVGTNSGAACPLVRRFYQRCLSPGGPPAIDTIALELGVSRQYLARQVRRVVGAPPKVVARVARFRNALRALRTGSTSPAEIAAGLGYYDQSHLIDDFRGFAGASPAVFARAGQFHPHCL